MWIKKFSGIEFKLVREYSQFSEQIRYRTLEDIQGMYNCVSGKDLYPIKYYVCDNRTRYVDGKPQGEYILNMPEKEYTIITDKSRPVLLNYLRHNIRTWKN